jgi:hypothetical protein
MYLIYQPEGSDEPKRWRYEPKRLMSPEQEALERYSGKDFSEFTQLVLKGNSRCRRALLWMYLKRDHPGVKFDDVAFAWDEVRLEYSKSELEMMRDKALEGASAADVDRIQQHFDTEIATAYEDDEGKAAGLPIAG